MSQFAFKEMKLAAYKKRCLSLFRLLKEKPSSSVSYQQQKFISQSSVLEKPKIKTLAGGVSSEM